MPAFLALELWSNLACASGSRLGYVPVVEATVEERFEGKVAVPRLTVSAAKGWAGASDLDVMKVLRVAYVDGSFDEFRISSITDSGQQATFAIQADGIILDLAVRNSIVTTTSSPVVTLSVVKTDTPTNLLTTALGVAPSYFAVGTVTPSTVVSVTLDKANPLAAAIATADAVLAATGATYELSARRNGTTDYKLDLTIYNASAATPDLRTGKNLLVLKRTRATRDLATRIVPIGTDGLGLGDNQWLVSAVSLNTYIDVVDLLGTGLGPAIEADQFNTAWYVIDDGNGAHQITDTVVVSSTTTRLYMASTSGIAANEWVRIAANSSKDEAVYVESPAAQATYGIRTVKLTGRTPGATNYLLNPALRDFAASAFTSWTQLTNALGWTQDTGVYLHGTQSAKSSASNDFWQSRSVYLPRGGTYTYTLWYRVTALPTGTDTYSWIVNDGGGTQRTILTLSTSSNTVPLGEWIKLSASYQFAAGTRTIYVAGSRTAGTGGANLYFDSAQFSPGSPDWVEYSGGAQLWQAGLAYLQANATPTLTYEVQLVDLERLDATTWPYDALVLGGTVNLTDPDTLSAPVSVRVTTIRRNLVRPLETTLTLSTQRETLSFLLAGGA